MLLMFKPELFPTQFGSNGDVDPMLANRPPNRLIPVALQM